jgi:hypothetical protein
MLSFLSFVCSKNDGIFMEILHGFKTKTKLFEVFIF